MGFTFRLVRLPARLHEIVTREKVGLARSSGSQTCSMISFAYVVLYPKEQLRASPRQRPKSAGRSLTMPENHGAIGTG